MASFMQKLVLGASFCALLPVASVASSDVFLGNRGAQISAAGLSHGGLDLLHELEKVSGRDHREATESRVGRLEEALRPMFAAMPKDAEGRLESAAMRYMLHRLFVQRHGWFVTGLDNARDAWNNSSPAAVFKEHATDHHDLFHEKLSSHGFSLHQVAVFAATLETLVHGESIERLQAAYRVLGLSQSESVSDKEGLEIIQAYMLMYVQETNISSVTPGQFAQKLKIAPELYPTFPDTIQFAHAIRERILDDTEEDERNTWKTILKVVEEIAERYGRWQDKECHVLKGMLLEMEQSGTGRVRLEDFYAPALHNSSWQFIESVPYLQQLGALDEISPGQKSVIITNYINSPANCVASSKFYSVCCIDQCEDLLSTLENKIAAPDATPARILEIVSMLTSDTVNAPRSLPMSIAQRLVDIAAHHGGLVPLHGRLFAQWMHHAYPRECPYPHVSGTTNPLTQEEWLESSDQPMQAEMDEIELLLEESRASGRTSDVQAEETMPWSHEEELFVLRPKLAEAKSTSTFSRIVMFVGAPVLFMAWASQRMPKVAKSKAVFSPDHKYYV